MWPKCIWMVAFDRYTKSGAIAMTVAVAVVALFHTSEGSFFLSLCAMYVALPCWAFFVVVATAAVVVVFVFFYNLAEIGSIINFRTQHWMQKKERMYVCTRLCNAYYEFLMHSKLKRMQRASEQGLAKRAYEKRERWSLGSIKSHHSRCYLIVFASSKCAGGCEGVNTQGSKVC